MSTPQRIQLSRRAGFNLQEASLAINGLPARVVARPLRYGNPFRVTREDAHLWLVDGPAHGLGSTVHFAFEDRESAARRAVALFKALLDKDGVRRRAARDLRGFNLACWCPLPKPGEPDICHAAVLLEIANEAR